MLEGKHLGPEVYEASKDGIYIKSSNCSQRNMLSGNGV